MFQIQSPDHRTRTVNQWRRLLGRREARLKELQQLQAPDVIVEQEQRLILEAQTNLNKLLS